MELITQLSKWSTAKSGEWALNEPILELQGANLPGRVEERLHETQRENLFHILPHAFAGLHLMV